MLNHQPRALTVQSPTLPQVAGVVALVTLKLEGVEPSTPCSTAPWTTLTQEEMLQPYVLSVSAEK